LHLFSAEINETSAHENNDFPLLNE
jgi:hypothetical protein